MSIPNPSQPTDERTCASTCDCGPTVKPAYQIDEAANAFTLKVALPGVAKAGLTFTAENGRLHLTGRRAWQQPEGWSALHRESADAPFELVLTHDEAVDAGQITAELRDGVLHVTLPKTEAVKPRQIAVA